jgi:DNA recombination protein RmuC
MDRGDLQRASSQSLRHGRHRLSAPLPYNPPAAAETAMFDFLLNPYPNLLLAALAGAAAVALLLPWLLARRGQRERTAARIACEPELATLRAERAAALEHGQALERRLASSERELAERRERLDRLSDERADLAARAERVPLLEQQLRALEGRLDAERRSREEQEVRAARLDASLREQQRSHGEKLDLLTQAEQRLRDSFQTLAQQILEERAKHFGEQSQQQIGGLVEPLKQQLKEFREAVTQTYANEQRERGMLANEIQTLKQLNQQISSDAINLTRALRGDNKSQGAWGEMVLERILEASGLQAGREYQTQASVSDGDGGRARPDVIVRLPDDKDLVIDAKCSLVAYERFCNADDEASRALALREHLVSLRRHVDGLSARGYNDLPGLRTLDFVLLFIPVEAAFIEAVRADPELYAYALGRNVSLVSPSTLLATLRTVAHLWQIERRNLNAMEIADRAAKLHDNFVSLVGELDDIGRLLSRAQQAQAGALRRITEGGKGSVILQVRHLAELGAPVRKALPIELLRQAGEGESDGDDDAGDGDGDRSPVEDQPALPVADA